MDKNYRLTTLAIGGPLDGELITGEGDSAAGWVQGPLQIGFKPPSNEAPMPDVAFYRRMEFRYNDARGEKHLIEFWAADEIRDEMDVLFRLARGYHPVVRDLSR